MRVVKRAHEVPTLTRTVCTHVIDPNWFTTAPPLLPEVLSLKRAFP